MTKDRFRFRVWDTEKKEMIYGAEMAYDYMRLCPGGKIVEENCFGDVLENKRYIVEQCTGLKDKNGRLIYEGDIVILNDEDFFEKPIKTIIKWADGNASFGLFGSHNLYYGFSYYDPEDVEVVGNIHENPELLEGHNDK